MMEIKQFNGPICRSAPAKLQWAAIIVVAAITAFGGLCWASPAHAGRLKNEIKRIEKRIENLDRYIERTENSLLQAYAEANQVIAIERRFHNRNPGRAYYLYGSPFPQISMFSRVGINNVQPVYNLSSASCLARRLDAERARIGTNISGLQYRLNKAYRNRESLARRLETLERK